MVGKNYRQTVQIRFAKDMLNYCALDLSVSVSDFVSFWVCL